MHALANLAVTHVSIALLGALVAARGRCARNPVEALVVGYLFGAALLIAITYALAWFGYSRRFLVWTLWFLAWGGGMLRKPRRRPRPAQSRPGRARQNAAALAATLLGAGVLLADPFLHPSPASVNAYHFVIHLASFLRESTVYGDYILGLPILLGQTRLFESDALELMRWGPPLVAAAGIPALYVFAARIFGRRTGLLAAVLLAGSALFAPVVAGYQILFPQFAPLGLALPALLACFPRALRTGRRGDVAISAAALLFLAFAGTYFALLVAAGFFAWLLVLLALRKAGAAAFLRGTLLLALAPLWIAFHYGLALPHARPQTAGRAYANQVEAFALNPAIPDSERHAGAPLLQQAGASPTLRGLAMFLAPKRLHLLRPSLAQSALFWLMALLALPLLKRPATGRGLLGFALLFSAFATVTGMFDMPAYQGRHLFLMLLLSIPALAFFAVSRVLPLAEKLSLRAGFSPPRNRLYRLGLGAALLTCLPTLLRPPEAGRTIPASPDLILRQIPEDDLLIGLARSIPADRPQSLLFLARENAPRLPGEIVSTLNGTPGFSGLLFHRAAPAALAQFDVFTTHPPRFAALARADWDSLPAQPAREWDGLPLGPIVFQTPRLVCVRLAP